MTIKVDDNLVSRLVRLILSEPNEVTSAIDEDILWLGYTSVFDDLIFEVK